MDKYFLVPPAGNAEIPDGLRREFEDSEEWNTYRRLLQAVADAQAEGKSDFSAPAPAEGEVPAPAGDVGETGGPKPDSTDPPLCAPELVPPRRTPDFELSRERLELVRKLATELATIKPDLKGYCTAEGLKEKYPGFALWGLIHEDELKELVDGAEFRPKAYAESLTLRKHGITSRATLKKDRQKLRKAQRNRPSSSSS